MKPYPTAISTDLNNHTQVLNAITRIRMEDIQDFNNLNQLFATGRRVALVPGSATDVTTSRVGDFNITDSYAYFCMVSAGVTVWRRVALAAW